MATTMTLPQVDAVGLAWAAEGADGRRDENLVLYTNGKKLLLGPANDENLKTAICRVRTDSRKNLERAPTTLTIPVEWDSVFLTESAVEKFLFPYYEAQRLLKSGELEKLKKTYYDTPDYIGIVHIQPSRPRFLKRDGTTDEFIVETSVAFPLVDAGEPPGI